MKIIVLVMVAIILSITTGCVSKVNVDTVNIVASSGEMTINIGDTFFEREVMTGQKNVGDPNNSVFGGDAYRIELLLEAASNDRIKLGYSEYFKPPSPYGYYYDKAWLKKSAFSRTLEYDLKQSRFDALVKSFKPFAG
jgi:hypothetical protein